MKTLLSALFGLFGTCVFTAHADIDTVIVGGAVRDPGHHSRTTGMTLTQAIGKAGAASD